MNDTRARFTKWYYRKGYRMDYMPYTGDLIFSCPLWVKLLAYFLFSPCVYYREVGYELGNSFEASLDEVATCINPDE